MTTSAPETSLTDRIEQALRTTATTGWTQKPGEEKWDHHLEDGHRYCYLCALCTRDVPGLVAAVAAAVQPELDAARAENDRLRQQLAEARNATLTEGAELIREHRGDLDADAPWWDTRDQACAAALLLAARTQPAT